MKLYKILNTELYSHDNYINCWPIIIELINNKYHVGYNPLQSITPILENRYYKKKINACKYLFILTYYYNLNR